MIQQSEIESRVENLHARTVVVNSYGGPYTSTNVLRKFRLGHWDSAQEKFVDGIPPFTENVLAPEMKQGGVDVVLGGYGSIGEYAEWLRDLQEGAAAAMIVTSAAEMQAAKVNNKIGLQLCLHGPRSIEDGLEMLAVHRQLGATVFTLCSSYRNLITDGCREPGDAGLSLYGRRVVQELNRLRIAVDMSHISQRGFWEVLECASAPPIVTHSAASTICDSPRNLKDAQIRALAEAGSYLGIIFFPAYLAEENASVEHLLDHIDYVAELVGTEIIGLGADFCHYGWEWTSLVWARSGMPERRYKFPTGIEDTTRWKNVTRGLIRRGYNDEEILGILGANYLRIVGDIIG